MGTQYSPGHPWFYYLGGKPLYPKQILATVIESGYQGYLARDIEIADKKPEPQRSQILRSMRDELRDELFQDISRYREVIRDLHAWRITNEQSDVACDDIHTAASLKHNHIYNGLAHMVRLHDLLSCQPDLFEGWA